jgi:hypothetical protein
MRNVYAPITPPFEEVDFAEAILKADRLAAEKVIGDLVDPVIEHSQKGIKAFQLDRAPNSRET